MSDKPGEDVEARGGEKIDWQNTIPGKPLPVIPEPETAQVYDADEISEVDT